MKVGYILHLINIPLLGTQRDDGERVRSLGWVGMPIAATHACDAILSRKIGRYERPKSNAPASLIQQRHRLPYFNPETKYSY
eukprot:scaffold41083_cov191-Amphora_coffeaeformis.AAC.3